ncbi:PGL3 [Symbiodinium necroappetens]|uniref:PGL3 protein n=1 Tax=Symbiodinium necroappetens TaxID=1628268 RepID=A0A812TPZ5_9DINO|nr:PGL3 [Symbiodinium necroappetens]
MRVITMGGSAEGEAEAAHYEAELRALPESTLPRSSGLPVFDLCLIGVGDDGHFESLYPDREEIADASGRWVLAVDMKSPPTITLSPAAMMSSKKVLVASAGVSEKYPMGKSEAMKKAIEGMEGPRAFPASPQIYGMLPSRRGGRLLPERRLPELSAEAMRR